MRQLALKEVSSFILSKIPKEISKWMSLNEEGMELTLAMLKDGDQVFFVTEGSKGLITLKDYIMKNRGKIKMKNKLRILISISRVMMHLYKQGENNGHGHICPNNILVKIIF